MLPQPASRHNLAAQNRFSEQLITWPTIVSVVITTVFDRAGNDLGIQMRLSVNGIGIEWLDHFSPMRSMAVG